MKYRILLVILFVFPEGKTQYTDQTFAFLHKLDSIRHSSSLAKHFADVYFETTADAIHYFSKTDTNVQNMMGRMELRFANYFFRSASAYEKKLPVSLEWMAYYTDQNGSSLRYVLLGINAHINGDIWQALVNEFSKEELQVLKPHYFSYYKQLLNEYRVVYKEALVQNKRLRLFHRLSFGLDKWYGKMMLKRWRKRQMKLAELYFDNRPLFEKRLKKLHRIRGGINNLIRRHT